MRMGRFNVPIRWVDVAIFGRSNFSRLEITVVKAIGALAQLIGAVVLVQNTNPDIYVPLGVCAFVFVMLEGGMGLWRG